MSAPHWLPSPPSPQRPCCTKFALIASGVVVAVATIALLLYQAGSVLAGLVPSAPSTTPEKPLNNRPILVQEQGPTEPVTYGAMPDLHRNRLRGGVRVAAELPGRDHSPCPTGAAEISGGRRHVGPHRGIVPAIQSREPRVAESGLPICGCQIHLLRFGSRHKAGRLPVRPELARADIGSADPAI
jgi:hypothetical protein